MELKELMRESGIVGAGGAGFPSYAKLADGADLLVVNGAECEPLLYTDLILLQKEMPKETEFPTNADLFVRTLTISFLKISALIL